MQAWVEIELDTTPPEATGTPIDLWSVGVPYEVDIEFDQLLDEIADVYIIDSVGVPFSSADAIGDGNTLRATVSLLGATPGLGTLFLGVRDDVWNSRVHEFPINITGGVSILMEVPEREFWFNLVTRKQYFELDGRAFDFELQELD